MDLLDLPRWLRRRPAVAALFVGAIVFYNATFRECFAHERGDGSCVVSLAGQPSLGAGVFWALSLGLFTYLIFNWGASDGGEADVMADVRRSRPRILQRKYLLPAAWAALALANLVGIVVRGPSMPFVLLLGVSALGALNATPGLRETPPRLVEGGPDARPVVLCDPGKKAIQVDKVLREYTGTYWKITQRVRETDDDWTELVVHRTNSVTDADTLIAALAKFGAKAEWRESGDTDDC